MGQTLFRDARGVQWRVYEVSARTLARLPARRPVLPALRGGWLCFEAAREKRRLTSYPADWSALYDAGLAALCEAATVVRPVPLRARPPASAASEPALPRPAPNALPGTARLRTPPY